jgi:8-oxo-dGTP pyrophosphatase MutT (NUDIX family)
MTMATAANSALPIGYRKKIARDAAPAEKHAAGVIFVAPDGDILLLHRSKAEKNYASHWAWPGGGGEEGEQPEDTARRESREETKADIADDSSPMKPIDLRRSPNGIDFYTFASPVKEKFAPRLNEEHSGYTWAPLDKLPSPLHPAVAATLQDQVGLADDMQPEDWVGVRDGLLKWISEEESEAEHGEDCATDSALRLALDKDTVREMDRDGRMRVATAPISKANVCPYRGREIPGWESIGLDPDKIYNLLRDPDELKKAAKSFNGVQILRKHIPVNAQDHQPWDVVGSTGTDAAFDGEYLTNSLNIWTKDAIDGIESDLKKELSSGYHYRPDMTPGTFRGSAYDGVMRDIVGNHVALVEDGRAGSDVVVGDSTENLHMKPTRLAAASLLATSTHISPRLAMDIALPKSLFVDISTKNFAAKKTAIAKALVDATKGKLIKGMALDEGGLMRLLDALEDTKGADESATEPQHKAMEAAAHGESDLGIPKAVGEEFAQADKGKTFDAEAVKEWMKGKGMGEDDLADFDTTFPAPATDEDDLSDEEKAKAAKEKTAKDEADKAAEEKAKKDKEDQAKDKDMVSKPAMDAALKAHGETVAKQVRQTERDIRVACATVKDWVGEVPPQMAFDSAADVYRHALSTLGVDGAKDLHADALLPVLKAQPKPGARPNVTAPALGMDASTADAMTKIIGVDLGRIGAV